ncbi:MAG: polymer-forming cytoskeletal protein [candidate division Zixibacteria bacterium]
MFLTGLRQARIVAVALGLLCLIVCSSVHASEFDGGEVIEISRLHTIDDDFWASCNTFNLDGSITGDAMLFSYSTTIEGEINGSAHSFSRYYKQSGSVDGSVRCLAQTVNIDGYVGRSLETACEKFTLGSGGVIGRDALVCANDVRIEGTIRGEGKLYGAEVRFTGNAEGNLTIEADQITIAPPAVIQGDLICLTPDSSSFIIESGVTILGQHEWQTSRIDDDDSGYFSTSGFILGISNILAALLFGLIIVRLFRPYAQASYNQLRTRTLVSLAAGAAGLVGLAVANGILLLSILGFAGGSILVASGEAAIAGGPILVLSTLMLPITGFMSIAGGLLFYSGKIVAATVLGGLIMKSRVRTDRALSAAPMVLGLTLITILFSVPILGFLVFLGTLLIGGGSIFLGIMQGHADKPGKSEDPPTTTLSTQ